MPRILLVGTGITSAVTGALIRQKLPQADLVLWDKARGAGGRMCTHRNSHDQDSTLDMGAQYISTTPDYAKVHHSYYDELKRTGLLSPLSAKIGGMRPLTLEGTELFVAKEGISSVVKHFLRQTDSDIKFQHHVEKIDQEGQMWNVTTKDGVRDQFDVVVLTMPVPQILALSGQIKTLIDANKLLSKNLRQVEYSSRFALGLFFGQSASVELRDENCAEYISDPIMRYVSIDNKKRNDFISLDDEISDDVGQTVVFHTSAPFGKAHLDKSPTEIESTLVSKVKELYPKWPEPVDIKCHKWRFSQVTSAYPGLPGAVKIASGLIAGGDGFTHSNFDSCLESATTTSKMVIDYLFDR